MGTAAIIVGTGYIGSLVVAFLIGDPPAEIVVAIPGVLYLAHRWQR